MIYLSSYASPLGKIILAANDSSLIGAWFEGQKYFMQGLKDESLVYEDTVELKKARAWLDDYFAGRKPEISQLKLAPKGSDFALSIWELLKEIPYGKTTTYGELAKIYAAKHGLVKMSAQAVGGAVGHNPLSIIVPCHRVVGSDGKLTGYAGGLQIKEFLLNHEKN